MSDVVRLMDAAVAVLQESGGALGIKEIVKRATDKGILDTTGSTPERSMATAIYGNIQKLGKESAFMQTGKGMFKLRARSPKPLADRNVGTAGKQERKPSEQDRQRSADNRYVGTAGERRVESELLLRGYATSTSAIDEGVDIQCSKSGRNYNIQVKTVNIRKDGKHIFSIKEQAFSKNDGPEMWYVFALLDDYEFDFVTMSSKDVKRMVELGHMTKNKTYYQASFAKTKDGIFLGKNREDMRSYKNDWNI